MDVLVIVKSDDRTAAPLIAAVGMVAGERPVVVHNGGEAELALRSLTRDLVLLDPDVAAVELARNFSEATAFPVVVWLNVRSSSRAAHFLDTGADDVLDPSMADVEMVARLRRLLGRRDPAATSQPAVLGDLEVDARLRTASWRGTPLSLTPRETEVLQVLVAAAGRPVTREVIYRQVWRWAMPRGDRTVDVNIKRLRGKLATVDMTIEIVTLPGVGYQLRVSDPDPAVTAL